MNGGEQDCAPEGGHGSSVTGVIEALVRLRVRVVSMEWMRFGKDLGGTAGVWVYEAGQH